MNIHHTLIFFYFSLWTRNTGLINAEIIVSTGNEGGNITVPCIFYLSGIRKIFCKETCEEGEALIETDDDRAQSGRYSIAYKEGTFPIYTILNVSITNLTKSDAGKYRCGLDRSLLGLSYQEIEIRVEDAPISSKPTLTLQPFPASVPSASTPTTTPRLSSSPGSCTPSPASPEAQTTTGTHLYVRLTLIIMIIVLSASVLIISRKRASTPEELSVENEYADVTEANRMSEEIREEDGQSASPPIEMSTVYTFP